MSGLSLVTKGMICQGTVISGGGTYGRPTQEVMVESPIVKVTKVKTKVIKTGIDLSEIPNISFKVDKVLSSY